MATSTTLRRRWQVDGEVRHHLIDPATGLPSESDLTLATVVAGEAWAAEVLAKAVLLRGSAHPFDLIDGSGAEALVVDDDGTITVSSGLPEFLGGASIARRIIPRDRDRARRRRPMTSQLWWYTARAGGLVAWALLSASVLWGLSLSTRALGKRPRPNWLLDLHRFLGGAAVVFTGIHVLSLMLDSYVHFGLVEVLVPFASQLAPGAVAWGIAGLYLLARRRDHLAAAQAALEAGVAGRALPQLPAVRHGHHPHARRRDRPPVGGGAGRGRAGHAGRRALHGRPSPSGHRGAERPAPPERRPGAALLGPRCARPRDVKASPALVKRCLRNGADHDLHPRLPAPNRGVPMTTPRTTSPRRRPHPARRARRRAGAASALGMLALTGCIASSAGSTTKATTGSSTAATSATSATTATTATSTATATTAKAATPSTVAATSSAGS